MTTRRAFSIGALAGALAFLQGAVVLHHQSGPLTALELWALAWTGVFGLTLSSTFATAQQAFVSVGFAGIALVLFYSAAAVIIVRAYQSFRRVGVVAATMLVLLIHVGLYLVVIRSMVA
jgi:hypothetical protein